jgi:hypothetical protein
MPEPFFMKLSMYIMTPELISTARFINPYRQSVCLYVYSLSLLSNGSVKTLPLQLIHTQKIVGHVISCVVRVVSRKLLLYSVFSNILNIWSGLKQTAIFSEPNRTLISTSIILYYLNSMHPVVCHI